MPTIELWFFEITDPQTGKRRRTTYRLTIEEARARYVDPVPIPNSREVREISEQRGYGHVVGGKTKARKARGSASAATDGWASMSLLRCIFTRHSIHR